MFFLKKISFLLFFFSLVSFSQETIKHTVVSGESVYSIAKKYNVTESEIFDLNPKAKGLLQLNMVLLVPKTTNKKKDEKKEKFVPKGPSHKVVSGESLYTIAKKYDTSIEKLREANPQLDSNNLQLGALLALPKGVKEKADEKLSKLEKAKIIKLQGTLQKHTVVSGESFYTIAKKYQVSVNELRKVNPQVNHDKLDVKDVVYIPGTENEVAVLDEKKNASENKTIAAGSSVPVTVLEVNPVNPAIHEVQPKETKYGISKRYGISITELEQWNPQITSGLEVGQQLVVKKTVENNTVEVVKVDTTSVAQNEEMEESSEVLPLTADAAMKADFLVGKASEYLGVRYRSGGTDRNGFDCSGLMFTTFRNIDVTLPRSSSDMAATFGKKIKKRQAQKGDLIFFTTRGRWVGHVGLITEVVDDEIKFIHSATHGGVVISSTKEPYYSKRFVQVNRVLN